MDMPQPVIRISLRSDSRVSIRSTLRRGWDLLKADFWSLLGFSFLACILASLVMQFFVTTFFLIGPILAGVMFGFVKRARGEASDIDMLLLGFRKHFKDLAIINLVTSIPLIPFLIGGMVLTVGWMIPLMEFRGPEIPWEVFLSIVWIVVIYHILVLLLSIAWQFMYLATNLCLDHDIGARESLSLTWQVARKHGGKIALFATFWFILAIIGMFLCYIGVFFVWALICAVQAYLYEDLFESRYSIEPGPEQKVQA